MTAPTCETCRYILQGRCWHIEVTTGIGSGVRLERARRVDEPCGPTGKLWQAKESD